MVIKRHSRPLTPPQLSIRHENHQQINEFKSKNQVIHNLAIYQLLPSNRVNWLVFVNCPMSGLFRTQLPLHWLFSCVLACDCCPPPASLNTATIDNQMHKPLPTRYIDIELANRPLRLHSTDVSQSVSAGCRIWVDGPSLSTNEIIERVGYGCRCVNQRWTDASLLIGADC